MKLNNRQKKAFEKAKSKSQKKKLNYSTDPDNVTIDMFEMAQENETSNACFLHATDGQKIRFGSFKILEDNAGDYTNLSRLFGVHEMLEPDGQSLTDHTVDVRTVLYMIPDYVIDEDTMYDFLHEFIEKSEPRTLDTDDEGMKFMVFWGLPDFITPVKYGEWQQIGLVEQEIE